LVHVEKEQSEQELSVPHGEASEAEQMGTADIQILLRWFYEMSDADGWTLHYGRPQAA